MLDSTATASAPDTVPAARLAKARQANLGMGVALLVQFVLGAVVQLYVTVPASDHGGGALAGFGHALTGGPAALAAHAGFGILLLGAVVQVLIRAFQLRQAPLTVLAVVNALAVVGAAFSGAGFVGSGASTASMTMAALTAVALLCSLLSLFLLGRRAATAG